MEALINDRSERSKMNFGNFFSTKRVFAVQAIACLTLKTAHFPRAFPSSSDKTINHLTVLFIQMPSTIQFSADVQLEPPFLWQSVNAIFARRLGGLTILPLTAAMIGTCGTVSRRNCFETAIPPSWPRPGSSCTLTR